jgi:hypothetical protein
MTGSGKTGLGITLLEEAAIDGLPVIAIDPKGDLGNLLLTFPRLRPADFRPWIDEGEATRQGRTPDEHARATATLWRDGLAEWGQSPARITRFAGAVDRVIYTPGSHAGRPLSVLGSLAAPTAAVAADDDALLERVATAVSGLLGLLGVQADPIRSREHILLSSILMHAWRDGHDLDLATLIQQIQRPPLERVGVMALETFFPADDRFALAMTLNNVIAAPGFAAWREGDALDVGRLLYGADGRSRLAIISIAHLSDAQRMFVVTMLLSEIVSWMRGQSGSRSLRAILYMDEVFGYFPPTANPPSKRPMLTLLKQARAYGLGVVLATQNPVDLDYKGLSNAGTWFLGRLQTERDKARVIEGLEGASATTGTSFDRPRMERVLAGLGNRRFLMHNVHEDGPVLFQTRWTLSYLAGPLTRAQIKTLTRVEPPGTEDVPPRHEGAIPDASPRPVERTEEAGRPVLPAGIPEVFLPVGDDVTADGRVTYRPALLGVATLHHVNAPAKVDTWDTLVLLAPLEDATTDAPWDASAVLGSRVPDLEFEPVAGAVFTVLPSVAAKPQSYTRWKKMLGACVYREHRLRLWRCTKPKLHSRPGESRGEFMGRVRDAVREQRDLEIEKLRQRFAPKLVRLEERIREAEQRIEVESSQYEEQKLQTVISIGATVVGALFGRKLGSTRSVGRATTAARGAGRAARARGDITRAREKAQALRGQLADLEARCTKDIAALRTNIDPVTVVVDEVMVSPRKSDLDVQDVVLVWRT